MQYIVELPETRLEELSTMMETLNPGSPEPIPASTNEDGNIADMRYVRDFYTHNLPEGMSDPDSRRLRPWEELNEETRMAFGAYLAGFIGWQFPDFTNQDIWESFDIFLDAHPNMKT